MIVVTPRSGVVMVVHAIDECLTRVHVHPTERVGCDEILTSPVRNVGLMDKAAQRCMFHSLMHSSDVAEPVL